MKWFKKLTLRSRANRLGQKIIAGRLPFMWSKAENRNLIRINRICAGLKPFKYTLEPRKVREVYECQVSLYKFGNVKEEPSFGDSVRDLVGYNNSIGVI